MTDMQRAHVPSSWRAYLAAHQPQALEELFEFLRIPSIAALPQHAADVERAAAWLAARLAAAGLEQVEVLPTGGHPLVYGEWLHAPGRPTVLVYGHFEVQPVDPLDEWTSPPFAPSLRDGRIYARGATDDKGNLLLPILAAEAFLRGEERLPLNVKVLLEGQEEIGSPQLPLYLAANRERLRCDLVISADGGRCGDVPPRLVIGTRGLCALHLDVQGATSDLHSGLYGGAVQNPIQALAAILTSLRSLDGRVLVEGFYDAVQPLDDAERRLLVDPTFDEAAFRARLGVPALIGEPGYTVAERIGARPTLEVNGIWGGFQGDGIKTVIPNSAHAKLTCRLVADQDPARIVDLLVAHVERQAPPGATVAVRRGGAGAARPYLVPASHPGNRAALDVLTELAGPGAPAPVFTRLGGSVPICDLLRQHLGAYTIFFGFGRDDEGQHAPNEFLRLDSFERGQVAFARLFERLSEAPLAAGG